MISKMSLSNVISVAGYLFNSDQTSSISVCAQRRAELFYFTIVLSFDFSTRLSSILEIVTKVFAVHFQVLF